MPEDVTPVRKQYLEIKRDFPGTILFFRLGDFYETFDEDAEITARELDIVLTSRPIGKGVRAPLAGIPYHAVDSYLSKLVQKGYHVAICEQMGQEPVKGIFPRKVVRVVTPGTVVEPTLLPGDANNYLAAVITLDETNAARGVSGHKSAGLAYADITTGEFCATELDPAELQAELARLRAAELLIPEGQSERGLDGAHESKWPAWRFEIGKCEEVLRAHFGVSTLDGFGLRSLPLATRAAGAILQYIETNQPQSVPLLRGLRTYQLTAFMTLDAATRRNLELEQTLRGDRQGSLLGLIDHTVTPMGRRLMQQWLGQPLLATKAISSRQDNVQFFLEDGMRRAELRSKLKGLIDLERIVNRLLAGRAQPADLIGLRRTLEALPDINGLLQSGSDGWSGSIAPPHFGAQDLELFRAAADMLASAVSEEAPATLQTTGIIRQGYSAELDSVIEASQHARDWIANLETVERERTGIKSLKVGYNKVFGYYIEISRGAASKAPDNYIRKQTLVNGERYITPEMKEYETLVLNAEESIHELEIRLFNELTAELSKSAPGLLLAARTLAELDVYGSFAEVAAVSGYVRPQVTDDGRLDIRGGRHPVVERALKTERYVPNDTTLEAGEIIRLITGPNMSGKSTYLRQVALIVLLAQVGSFVPAESAQIGLVDRIFTRIGAQDEIHAGQSTFMVEMIEAANILHHATSKSLLILDEIGRGTSTYDGVSIAWAVVEHIHNHPHLRSRTLFATHYHELTRLADVLPGVRNFNVAVSEADGNVVFLHKIVAGGADRSYGIHVAQLAGLPGPVIQRANEILEELEKTSGQVVHLEPHTAQQVALFPETNPLVDELRDIDENSLSPIEALNKVYEWKRKYTK